MALSLEQVSEHQLEEMKHALGLGRNKKPYRNYFNCDVDDKSWNDLVKKGFATRRLATWADNSAFYYLTFEAVKLVYGKRMSKKYYDNL